jgi:predicted O-methyltransferase YrrM
MNYNGNWVFPVANKERANTLMMVQTHLPIVPQVNDDPLSQYTLDLLHLRPTASPVDAILREMEAFAAEQYIPIVGPVEGAIIQSLIASTTQPRQILELGTAIGYSTIWLARALRPGSYVTTIEMDAERAGIARRYISRAGLADRVTVLEGDFFDILPTLEAGFDVIFQDFIKHLYFEASADLALQVLESCVRLLKPNGLMLGDNAFCLGEVVIPPGEHLSNRVAGIQAYNLALAKRPDLESVIIPVRDGLWVSYKRA